ncbi:MAG: DeoR/GlpR transcriptional regulator [Nocardioidaceae bacterium]|jgi:DeoR/GlpR family transcriptional regulator of sugar metabolism|nr:DeoR/GlpR transcriptional regulator [Nocardioidaceae bacterium]
MLAHRRYEQILDRLRDDGPVEVKVLADVLSVSEATVRRDLARLERDGVLHRVRGGAALSGQSEPPFAQTATRHLSDKEAVASRAAAMIGDGDVVLLDIGTTVHRLAARLTGRHVTVVTSSLAVYEELARDAAVDLMLLGGSVRRNYRSLVGFLTEQALRQIHVGTLFLGTSGILDTGAVLDTTTVEVPVKHAMIAAADRVVLLADPGKFPGSGLARVCGPEDIDVLVTREPACERTRSVFTDAGVEVVLA